MRRHLLAAAGLVSLIAVAGLARQPQRIEVPQPPGAPQRAPDVPAVPALPGALVSIHGPFSKMPEAGIVRITDEASFDALWARHVGDSTDENFRASRAYPDIDFTRCMVIACFDGPSVNSDGQVVESVEVTDKGMRLRYDGLTYQTASFGGERDRGNPCAPFGIWVLPRYTGPVIVEENTQGMLNQPPKWTERIRFEALP